MIEITREDRQRLAEYMEERCLDLGLTWRDVARRSGLSYESIRALRAGPGRIRRLSARKIDRAFEWRPGSVESILNGGEPTPSAVTFDEQKLIEEVRHQIASSSATEQERTNGTVGLSHLS